MRQTDAIDKYLQAKESNMPEQQAQLFARSWAEACEPHPEMATKSDIRHLEMATSSDIRHLESEIKNLGNLMYILGGAMFLVVCSPFAAKILRSMGVPI